MVSQKQFLADWKDYSLLGFHNVTGEQGGGPPLRGLAASMKQMGPDRLFPRNGGSEAGSGYGCVSNGRLLISAGRARAQLWQAAFLHAGRPSSPRTLRKQDGEGAERPGDRIREAV